MNKYSILLLLVFIFPSCKVNKLDSALRLAKENRGELLKVLEHYAANPADSLKYKAAVFLIENMPGHFSYSNGEDIAGYYEEISCVLDSELEVFEKKPSIDAIFKKYSHLSFDISEDLQVITADFLIHNIDFSFGIWETKAWSKDITFEDFCEYVLPYKYREYQQLDYWKDSLSGRFDKRVKTFYDDWLWDNTGKIAELINQEIRDNIDFRHGFQQNSFGFLSSSTIHKTPYGTCDNISEIAVSILRSHGIPSAIDILPQWGNNASGHSWYTIFNNDGRIRAFPWGFHSGPGDRFALTPMAKVYRLCYSPDKEMEALIGKADNRFLRQFRFYKDVTDEYEGTSDLSLRLFSAAKKERIAYLAACDRNTWNVIGLGNISNGKATFNKVGRGVVYLVFIFDGLNLIPVSHPFLLKNSGEVRLLTADLANLEELTLKRKYPITEHTWNMENRMIGGRIEASDYEDFSQFKTFFEIENMDYPDLIPIYSDKPYRYWRYRGGEDSWCNIAELEFYEKNNDQKAIGKIIGTNKPWSSSGEIDNAFDGDRLTVFDCRIAEGGWVGMDFTEPVYIENVRCVPRSDDNGISYGDIYELKYWGEHGWVSLGIQKAEDKKLNYERVPKNSLLILQNHTRGVQERVFIWEDNKQIFR